MKILTLYEPYATLIATGAKIHETRSWGTSYRGPIAIHAGKSTADLGLCDLEPYATVLRGLPLTLGSVVAIAHLTACVEMTHESVENLRRLSKEDARARLDYAFGAWEPGRFAWKLEKVHSLTTPIPQRGGQGLRDWTLPADTFGVCLKCRQNVRLEPELQHASGAKGLCEGSL